MKKFFCDCCGAEIKSNDIEVIDGYGIDLCGITRCFEVCPTCYKEYMAIETKFNELRKEALKEFFSTEANNDTDNTD